MGADDIPIDVWAVTRVWNNLSILEEHIDGPGYLLPLGKLGAEIIVRQADSIERRRFTIAHELGHWILGITREQKNGEFKQPGGVRSLIVEKWCDAFAASFLIPRDKLVDYFSDVHDTVLVRHTLNAPRRFRVSEEALFLRAYEVLGMRIAFVRSEETSLRIVRTFVPSEVVHEIESVLVSPQVQELVNVNNFCSRIKFRTREFVLCWSKLPGPQTSILILHPCDFERTRKR
jgi:hypothetical protein